MEMSGKKIEVVYLKPQEINNKFGNPRKITKKNLESLKNSIEKLDDFGVIVIDENNSVIAGNQRIEAMKQLNIKTPVLCKKLIGYTEEEKKAINIKSNTHAGEFDMDEVNKWIDDINLSKLEINLDFFFEKNESEKNEILPIIEADFNDKKAPSFTNSISGENTAFYISRIQGQINKELAKNFLLKFNLKEENEKEKNEKIFISIIKRTLDENFFL